MKATVHSSDGNLVIDNITGVVLELEEYEGCAGSLSNIVAFDVDEYYRYYPGRDRSEVDEYDILDLGQTCVGPNGTVVYEPPLYSWREDKERNIAGELEPAA